MLYIAIPAHNEVETIGVLLWRLRSVLAEFPREYEVVVYDDASSDSTREVLEGYARVLPLTVLGGERQVGYAKALDQLLRHVVRQTRYPRRDAVLLLQGDFTDPPGLIPEFARRFEGGADIVLGERTALADAPVTVQRLFRYTGWSMRPFVRIDGVQDVTSSLRLVRIAAVRDLLQERGDLPLCEGDSWTANADLLLRLVPFARRIETVPVQSTYGVRLRETRRVASRDAMAALKWAWSARRRRVRTMAADVDAPARGRDDVRLTLARSDVDERPARPRRGERSRGTAAGGAPRARGDATSRGVTDAAGKTPRPRRDRAAPLDVVASAAGLAEAVDETKIGSDEASLESRRRKRKKRSPRKPHVPDGTEETLSLFDPAAGIAADLDLGASAVSAGEDGEEGAAGPAGDALDEAGQPRRRKRRRRKRTKDAGGEARATGDGVEETESDSRTADGQGEIAAFRRSSNHADAGDDASGVAEDFGPTSEGGDEAGDDAGDADSAAGRARRRGRRGRRGGRRTRRSREGGEGDAAGEVSSDAAGEADGDSGPGGDEAVRE